VGEREYRYRVDLDGHIFHDDTEIVDPGVLRFFLLALRQTEDGRWRVMCQGESNWFDPVDTPFVVQRLEPRVGDERLEAITLVFAGDHREPLDPATLVTESGRIFCRVRQGTMIARLGRLAMQQLAPFLTEESGTVMLRLGGSRWPIRAGDAGTAAALP
jgi:hypothetical protein